MLPIVPFQVHRALHNPAVTNMHQVGPNMTCGDAHVTVHPTSHVSVDTGYHGCIVDNPVNMSHPITTGPGGIGQPQPYTDFHWNW